MSKVSQGIAIFAMAFLVGMVAHKSHADISMLAQKHSGGEFWVELGRYVIRNLAGGG